MPSKIFSCANIGLSAQLIEVETDISYGLKSFDIVGLPDKAVEESKDRVRTALKSCGFKPPLAKPEKVLVNLAPADLKKEGALYDLPIALSYLLNSRQIQFKSDDKVFAGELSLDGRVRPIKGALLFSQKAEENGFLEIIVPKANAEEASLCLLKKSVQNFKIIGVENLSQTINYLIGKEEIAPCLPKLGESPRIDNNQISLAWIKGQDYAKRAITIAAAGAHNLLMLGPPGGGKSLLAKAMPSILPPINRQEMLELTKIYSVAGLLTREKPIIRNRPFRVAHHTASLASIIGGGNPIKPGEITLAHRGILFLDEFPEFKRDAIEALRQPLEDGNITIMRAGHQLNLPCNFSLIAASNPCPCGFLNDPVNNCSCSPSQIAKYRRKLSGPIIDRIDIFVDLPAVEFERLEHEEEDKTDDIRNKVINARKKQKQRLEKDKMLTNSEMQIPQIKKYCQVDSAAKNILKNFVDSGKLSARGYHRVLKVSRTIADLENSDNISLENMNEALAYRSRQKIDL
ncbi:YifB family Mg chelatase-like AAA ATPase [Patescibacteria group bacterium]|nr:YifB family Mg chelatase-like AAA ATPase [Patescibacteria group bacterium]MBU4023198.1 YifB family Mg chelatase-like AAA ATPase [Patescibacteria group bacterium]